MEYEKQVRNSRILVVDDLIANVSLLENILHRMGYKHIRSLTDPRAVEEVVAEWRPDLIVLDLAMPHLSGLELMERLRAPVPKQDWVPVLILTADGEAGTRRKALAAGANEYLTKPFDIHEIILRIRNLLLIRILHAELRDQNRLLEYRVEARTRSLSERTQELEEALTELKQTQQQVVQHERFRAFGEMAGGVAHDFNNVLMCVIGYTDLLLSNPNILSEKEMARKFLRTMNSAGHDASKIVARLRDFYRPREESEVFTRINLNQLLEEVVPLTQPKWKTQALASGRVIDLQMDLVELPPVTCNPAEIREMLVNLIFNAVDAMPQGGVVTLRTRCDGAHVSMGISDTGTGMSPEVQERCMEPFFSTKGQNGTGLGLSMVFGIVKRHEGVVEIESVMGEGTTFWIRLSTGLQEHDPGDASEEAVERPLRILVVDDEPVALDILCRYLHADGHSTEVACDAREAMDKFVVEPFDVVITDQAMPGLTGCQLAAAIRERVPDQPILLFAMYCESRGHAAEEVPPGIDLLASKALSQKDLSRAVARALRRRPPIYALPDPPPMDGGLSQRNAFAPASQFVAAVPPESA